MSDYTQANRPIAISTPLGPDVLLLTGFKGREGVSELFRFRLTLIADAKTPIAFDKILGQNVTVELELPAGARRYINGIVRRFVQGRRDDTFTHFRAEVVPKLWLLTRKVQSRIFQRMTVPEILQKVLTGIPSKLELTTPYEPRDFCTQYRESDFSFASRLMEEEGIRYSFEHANGTHRLVLSDQADQHPDVPGQNTVVYDEIVGGGKLDEMRVTGWEKAQEVRSDLTTLWDHCFELPGKNLEAQQPTVDTVPVGKARHKLKVLPGEQLEIYDFPGRYAQRFDGIDVSGGLRPAEIQKIFRDNLRERATAATSAPGTSSRWPATSTGTAPTSSPASSTRRASRATTARARRCPSPIRTDSAASPQPCRTGRRASRRGPSSPGRRRRRSSVRRARRSTVTSMAG